MAAGPDVLEQVPVVQLELVAGVVGVAVESGLGMVPEWAVAGHYCH